MAQLNYKIYEFNPVEYFIETDHGNYIFYKYSNKNINKLIPFEGDYKDAKAFLENSFGKLIDNLSIFDIINSNFKIESTVYI